MKKILLSFALLFSGAVVSWGAPTHEGGATSISFGSGILTRSVTLRGEYDPEDKTTSEVNGVYYFKATLRRGMSYTVWTEGASSDISVDAYPAEADWDSDKFEPGAGFTELDEFGYETRLVMSSDEWYIDDEDPEWSDPASWTYYFCVAGNIGSSVTVNFQQGVIVPKGRDSNPQAITPSSVSREFSSELQIGGEYYFRTRLTAGRMYSFATAGGDSNLVLTVSADISSSEDSASSPAVYSDSAYDDDPGNSGIYVVPATTGYHDIIISGLVSDELKPFALVYKLLPNKDVEDHDFADLDESNGYEASFVAGKESDVTTGYYDDIIDESLFRFAVEKGERYVVKTSGSSTNLVMRVYDSDGEIVAENENDGLSMDARCAFIATSTEMMYVGVCQKIDNPFVEEPVYESGVIKIINAAALLNAPDEWDNVDDEVEGASGLTPVPGVSTDTPESIDPEGHGWHQLDMTDWSDTYVIAGRAGVTYALRASLEEPLYSSNMLKAEVFTLRSNREYDVNGVTGDINPGSSQPLTFTATANNTYYIRISVAQGAGLDYQKHKIHTLAYSSTGQALGILTVNTKGADGATWSINRESVKYPGGASVLLPEGTHTVKFTTVRDFKAPATQTVTVNSGKVPVAIEAYYSDTFDPKDDIARTATSWSLRNIPSSNSRTLWKNDPVDNFAFTAKDGQYYDFELGNVTGDAVFSITNATGGVIVSDVTSVSKLALPATRTKYNLVVSHRDPAAPQDGSYTISGFFANVGAIKFARNTLSAKENAASVKLTVNRTARDGVVRVRYGTVAGTAVPGVDYVAQNGVLEWADGDNKAKTIEIKLIPDLVAHYEGNKQFTVQLKPFEEDERGDSEYPAQITVDTCTVTLTEASRAGTTVESTYASKAVKVAKVRTEDVALETGTFYGVLAEDGFSLTNGLPALASVTLTVSTRTPAALSAKVMVGGKTYNFKGSDWADEEGGRKTQTLSLVQKIAGVSYTNTLTVAVGTGATLNEGDWLAGVGTAELVMNIPDKNNKGAQEDIYYTGRIYRYNDKIQDYCNAVTNFSGYYTVAVVPQGVSTAEGIPAGNGYLTLKVDNKGGVKVAGKLADGKNSVSMSAKSCGIVADEDSACGYSMYVPLFMAKTTICFGGELRIFVDKESGRPVVDSSRALIYNNDDPKYTYDNYEGFRMSLEPVGGWYDLVINLQTYYLTMQFETETCDVYEIPGEAFMTDYFVTGNVQPTGTRVDVAGDAFVTDRKSLVRDGRIYDLAASVNPCNVQVKLARATGLVSGSFSVWSESDDGSKQKEITGFKHYGVLVLARDPLASLGSEYAALGYCVKSFNITNENPDTGKTVRHSWNFSAPFNVLGWDQGDIDWWADDWGVNPED